jgi:hypothetical protein
MTNRHRLSVVICAHNPRPELLTRVLRALRRQSLTLGCWELLLIDNASHTRLADDWDLYWERSSYGTTRRFRHSLHP